MIKIGKMELVVWGVKFYSPIVGSQEIIFKIGKSRNINGLLSTPIKIIESC